MGIDIFDEVKFIAGTEYYFEFTVRDDLGVEVDITTSDVGMTIAYYGQPEYAVLTKAGLKLDDGHTFQVKLESSDTANLSGKFIYQPFIVDLWGGEFRPSQGILTIYPRINNV